MAPFGRGKSSSARNFQSKRGRFGTARSNKHAGRSGHVGTSAARSTPFQASRLDEAANLVAGSSDGDSEESGLEEEELKELSSLDETSESDAGPNVSYNVLLHTLKPAAPGGKPKRKRRKLETPEASPSLLIGLSGDSGGLEEIAERGDTSEEDVADESAEEIDDPKKRDCFTRHYTDQTEFGSAERIQAVLDNQWLAEKIQLGKSWSATRRRPRPSIPSKPSGHLSAPEPSAFKFKAKFERAAQELLSSPSEILQQLAASTLSYQDILFSARSLENAEDVRRLASVHALNHIFRTRDKVLKNNAKLSRTDNDEEMEVRDQGFTRPKVLMLMPTRQCCVKMVDAIIALCEPEQQENKKRFHDSYARVDESLSKNKPEDFKDLFGGNDDDMFRLGLKFTRKAIRFFSQFYSSDIILASPLGLRTALGGDKPKKQDHDFLSSIEVVIVDQSDALLMQNWEHVEYIFDHLNLQPREAHDCDFSRVRSWYLDGHARYYRQTVLLSGFNFPSLNRLYTQHMRNIDGKVKLSAIHDGAIMDLGFPVKQTFSRFDFTDPASEPDERFQFFTSAILPSIIKASSQGPGGQQGILVYIPLYADFVRVRNHLASSSSTQHISFGSISEYASVKEVARARSHFLTGRHSILLYTERAHHFRRYHLRGVKRVMLYGLPENPLFYREIVGGFLGSSVSQALVDVHRANVRCLFSKLDLLKLERSVGTKRYLSLLSEKGDTFDFI
ncbi:MAG: hypothetical protein Q9208_002200 [Pyrenodesmia sp. 3 TL-2023]